LSHYSETKYIAKNDLFTSNSLYVFGTTSFDIHFELLIFFNIKNIRAVYYIE